MLIAALAVGFARHQSAIHLPANHIAHALSEESILTRLSGRVLTSPALQPAEKLNPYTWTASDRTRFLLEIETLETTQPPTPTSGYLRVAVDGACPPARVGDRVTLSGWLSKRVGPRNPGETDWARADYLQGVRASLRVEGPQFMQIIGESESPFDRLIAGLRAHARALLFESFSDLESEGPLRLLDAMVLGQRSAIDRRMNDAFLRTGTLHFLSVSGFHVGVLAGAVWFLMRRGLRRGLRVTALVTLAVVCLYTLIAEPNAPILRSAVMCIIGCAAVLSGRPLSRLNWLALAALCVLVYAPLELFRAGFQLSFLQVLALLTVVPALYGWCLNRLTRWWHNTPPDLPPPDADSHPALCVRVAARMLLGLVVVCVVAWLISLPLVAYHFGRITPLGALQSIVLSGPISAVIVLGFVTVVTGLALPPLGTGLSTLVDWASALLLRAVDWLAQWPGTLLEVRTPPAWLVLLTYGLAVAAWLALRHARVPRPRVALAPALADAEENRRARRLRRFSALGALAAIALLWMGWLAAAHGTRNHELQLTVFSVGSGSANLLISPDGRVALLDAGTIANYDVGAVLARALRESSIDQLDAIAISHANFDHFSGVHTLLPSIPARELWMNPYFALDRDDHESAQQLFELLPSPPPARSLVQGDRMALGSLTVDVLWPPPGLAQNWKANDTSLVLRVSAFGRGLLIPGDIERQAMRALLADAEQGRVQLRSDVLVAPHHGSLIAADSARFYAAVAPELVLVSSGKPRPALEAMIAKTLGSSCRVLSTRDVGAISVRIAPDGRLIVETPFAPPTP